MLYLTPLLPQPSESPFPESLPPYVGAVLFETFLYGLYVILFAICAYVLLRRNTPLHWILLAIATVMFALATSDLVYTYGLLFRKLLQGGLTYANLRPKYWLYVTNNVLADALLLYRCFVVWEFRKLVLLGPVALLIAAAACGYAFEGANTFLFENAWIYLALTLILNVILTTMAAGRIWWLAKRSKSILGRHLLQRYNATIAILIESGVIYSLYIILDLALRNHPVGSVVLDAGLIQIVGIMPTLIIVQVGLGRAVHDIEANEAIARLEGLKPNSSGAIEAIQFAQPRQCRRISLQSHSYPHTHAHIQASTGFHPAALTEGEGEATNSSTDAFITKRNSNVPLHTLRHSATHSPLDAPSRALAVDGDIANTDLGALPGPELRIGRSLSLQLSWAEELGISPNSGLGLSHQASRTM